VSYAVVIMSLPDELGGMSDVDERLRRIESVTDAALAHLSVEDPWAQTVVATGLYSSRI